MTTAKQMAVPQAKAYYGLDYFHGGDYRDYQASEAIAKRNFARLIDRLLAIQPKGQLLEIGCAYGYFLDLASLHWDVTGIDISSEAISTCEARFGEAVHCGDLLEMEWRRDANDWVVAWDTIEHVDQPRRYLDLCFDLLKPGGHLALTTGDLSSFVARVMGPRWRLMTPPSHLTFFSRHGLEDALSDAGFQKLTFSTIGYYRSLDFAAYRLLGPRYETVTRRHELATGFLQRVSFYLNLHDIMLVIARKPR